MENIEQIERRLWEVADQLRADSKLTSTEYYMPVLGLIFLRHAFNRFLVVKEEAENNLPKRGFVEELDTEEKRAVREGLDEENLALFDLLLKPELSTRDRNRIKEVAKSLLEALKAEKLRVDQWREKEATRAAVRNFIHDFLWNKKTGLPLEAYTPEDVKTKAEMVFSHVFMQYPTASPSIYAAT